MIFDLVSPLWRSKARPKKDRGPQIDRTSTFFSGDWRFYLFTGVYIQLDHLKPGGPMAQTHRWCDVTHSSSWARLKDFAAGPNC